ncbi:MAG: hypothetical protein ACFB15_04760 [Cyclobacteriaceae bacterium]
MFESDSASSTYWVNYDQIQQAMNDLSQDILILHSDYDEVAQLVAEKDKISPQLQADLDCLSKQYIPVDVTFEQGLEMLGISATQ